MLLSKHHCVFFRYSLPASTSNPDASCITPSVYFLHSSHLADSMLMPLSFFRSLVCSCVCTYLLGINVAFQLFIPSFIKVFILATLLVFILQYFASLPFFVICAFRICHSPLNVPSIPSPSRLDTCFIKHYIDLINCKCLCDISGQWLASFHDFFLSSCFLRSLP